MCRSEEIEGDECLREEAVPKVQREVAVGTAKSGDEVVFEYADGAFGRVTAMGMRWYQLEVDLVGGEELF